MGDFGYESVAAICSVCCKLIKWLALLCAQPESKEICIFNNIDPSQMFIIRTIYFCRWGNCFILIIFFAALDPNFRTICYRYLQTLHDNILPSGLRQNLRSGSSMATSTRGMWNTNAFTWFSLELVLTLLAPVSQLRCCLLHLHVCSEL